MISFCCRFGKICILLTIQLCSKDTSMCSVSFVLSVYMALDSSSIMRVRVLCVFFCRLLFGLLFILFGGIGLRTVCMTENDFDPFPIIGCTICVIFRFQIGGPSRITLPSICVGLVRRSSLFSICLRFVCVHLSAVVDDVCGMLQ